MARAWLWAGLVLAGAGPSVGAQEPARPDGLIGRWQAVLATDVGAVHAEDFFDFEIAADGDRLRFRDLGRFPMVGGPSSVVVTDSGTIRVEWRQIMPFPRWLEGRLVDGGRVLAVRTGGLGVTGRGVVPLRLTRAPVEARRYLAPRLAPSGERVLGYSYRPPERIVGDWPIATPQQSGLDRRALEGLVRDVLAEGDGPGDRRTDGILVLRHGRIVLEEYFWGTRRELAHPIASITKSVASLLVGVAVDSGRLALDDLVADQFPGRADLWKREHYPIRIRDLLSMTAGVRWTDRSAADQYTQRFFEAQDQLGFVMDLPAVEPPGARYNYNNGLPGLLGPILARRVGEPVDVFADRVLFEPLGIRNYVWATLRDGTPLLAGGLRMPLRDMARLGQLILDGGEWRGRRIVSADWVARSTMRQTAGSEYPYGYYWHLSDPAQPWRGTPPSYLGPIDRYRAVMGIGQGGQAIVVLPEVDVVIVVASSNWLPGMAAAFPTELINRYLVPAIR